MAKLAVLQDKIRRIERGAAAVAAGHLSLDSAEIDCALGGKGLTLGCLHALNTDTARLDRGAVTGFAGWLAARIAGQRERPVLWVTGARDLYAPGLAALGLTPELFLVAAVRDDAELLWAMEQALGAPELAAVVGEPATLSKPLSKPLSTTLSATAARRLQLAAERSGVTALLVTGAAPGLDATLVSAVTRWQVASHPAMDLRQSCWDLELLRARGGRPGRWQVTCTGRIPGEIGGGVLKHARHSRAFSFEIGSGFRRSCAGTHSVEPTFGAKR